MIVWNENKDLFIKPSASFATEKERQQYRDIQWKVTKDANLYVDFESVETLNTLGCLILTSWWNHSIRQNANMIILNPSEKMRKSLTRIGLGKLLQDKNQISNKQALNF